MKKSFLKVLGPGLIWAGASVGVSHLVQSTRAGADFGFELIWVVILANLIKYPFFEFAPRYAASTGESLVHGYNRLGKSALILFFVLTLTTMFTIQSSVTAVTVGLIGNLFPGTFSTLWWTIILLSICMLILLVGKYKTLDRLMKLVILVLTISTIVSVISAFGKGFNPNPDYLRHFEWKFSDIAFLLALVGWMPSAVDVSVWHSMWTVAKIKQTGYKPKLKEALLDFNIGYIGTAFLAICFLSLGALVMYGSGQEFAQSGVGFASQLINLYTKSIGNWAFYIISIAALATMFSTTLTVLDAYPRVLKPTTELLFPKLNLGKKNGAFTIFWYIILITGTVLVIFFFAGKMRSLIDIATTLSFITAPVLGYLNLKVVLGKNVKQEDKPGLFLRILSWVGLVALLGFAVYFIVWRILNG
jgi:Mn2+/Fe2+ NRAMP family transporter